jgi:nitrogen-specific signal transduction histidine kinase/CheY-like chemotaxis protein
MLVFALDNVTERVRNAEDLQTKERQLAEIKRFEVVGQLAAGIAHDFNNVLTSMLFTLDFLTPMIDMDEDTASLVRDVLDVIQRSKTLTHQLLSFGRKQLLRPELLELNEAVRQRSATLRGLLGEDVELRIVTGSREAAHVEVDPGQLDRILLNLTANAADALPAGGKLTIMTTHVDIDATSADEHPDLEPGAYVMLSVQDDGLGMDRDTRERVFEPFFTTKDDGRNSGLGLSTVHGIVKQSGGEIYVHSEPGEGSTFKILFPRASPDEGSARPRLATHEGGGRDQSSTRVLVVEDDALIRRLIVEGLRRHGYTVCEAESGLAARRALANHAGEIGVVLTDIVMPEIDGVTLAEHIDAEYPGLPIVLMSGYADVGERVVSPERPLINKPFSPRDIAELLGRVLADAGTADLDA